MSKKNEMCSNKLFDCHHSECDRYVSCMSVKKMQSRKAKTLTL